MRVLDPSDYRIQCRFGALGLGLECGAGRGVQVSEFGKRLDSQVIRITRALQCHPKGTY